MVLKKQQHFNFNYYFILLKFKTTIGTFEKLGFKTTIAIGTFILYTKNIHILESSYKHAEWKKSRGIFSNISSNINVFMLIKI